MVMPHLGRRPQAVKRYTLSYHVQLQLWQIDNRRAVRYMLKLYLDSGGSNLEKRLFESCILVTTKILVGAIGGSQMRKNPFQLDARQGRNLRGKGACLLGSNANSVHARFNSDMDSGRFTGFDGRSAERLSALSGKQSLTESINDGFLGQLFLQGPQNQNWRPDTCLP